MKSTIIRLFAIFTLSTISYAQNLKIHFIDVGQGDAILIQCVDKNYLIDAGKNRSDDKLIDYINSLGVDTLHTCLMSHPDYDHFGELEDLIESSIVVNKIVKNRAIRTIASYLSLMDTIDDYSIPVEIIDYTNDLDWSLDTDVLAPNYDWGFSDSETNENSIVLLSSYGKFRFLFTGDVEGDALDCLLTDYDLDVHVLKVSHHGSKYATSSAFIEEVSPKVSIYSAGKNSYGHPTYEVSQILNDYGSIIYSTADDWDTWTGNGSADESVDDDIIVETDGEKLWVNNELIIDTPVETMQPQELKLLSNYPNPFNPCTQISYSISQPSDVCLKIYNSQGRLCEILNPEFQVSGNYSIQWNAQKYPSGIYICQLITNDFSQVIKMVLSR